MAWPTSYDYFEAVQNPKICFGRDELRAGHAAEDAQGLPILYSGNFASVFQFQCPTAQKTLAVKCFTRRSPRREDRYRHISKHLSQAGLRFTVPFTYVEKGIRVGGEWYPIVTMEWVAGQTLNEFLRANLDRRQHVEQLSRLWVRLAQKMREANITHADLQHGNVLLVPGADNTRLALKLVDYDGLYLPALADLPSGELGHRHYQHPQRLQKKTYSGDVDRFSHLVIYAAMRIVAAGGRLWWERFDQGENLLFCADDFRNPGKSRILHQLWQDPASDLRSLAGYLTYVSQQPLENVPQLDEIIDQNTIRPLTPAQVREVESILSGGSQAATGTESAATTSLDMPAAAPAKWPSAEDFRTALVAPVSAFVDPDLCKATVMMGADGQPLSIAGRQGIVFPMRSPDGQQWAVKCFTDSAPKRDSRYWLIATHVQGREMPAMVDFEYLQQGIHFKGQWYPALKMEWVDGQTLNQFVSTFIDQAAALRLVRDAWVRLTRNLHEAEIAHGDLQPSNVIVVPGKTAWQMNIRVIDYDGMWVPALADAPDPESGHPAYQHPKRLTGVSQGPTLDHFSQLVIYTALRTAQIKGRKLWQAYNRGDNLLFVPEDFQDPGRSKLLIELWRDGPDELRALAGRIVLAVCEPLADVPRLDDVLIGPAVRPLSDEQVAIVSAILHTDRRPVDAPPADQPEPRQPAGRTDDGVPKAPKTGASGSRNAIKPASSTAVRSAQGKRLRNSKVLLAVGGAAFLCICLLGGYSALIGWRKPDPDPEVTAAPSVAKPLAVLGEKWDGARFGNWTIWMDNKRVNPGVVISGPKLKQIYFLPTDTPGVLIYSDGVNDWVIDGGKRLLETASIPWRDYLERKEPEVLLEKGVFQQGGWSWNIDAETIEIEHKESHARIIVRSDGAAITWNGALLPTGPIEEPKPSEGAKLPVKIDATGKWGGAQFGEWLIWPGVQSPSAFVLYHPSTDNVLFAEGSGPLYRRDAKNVWYELTQFSEQKISTVPSFNKLVDELVKGSPPQNEFEPGMVNVMGCRITVSYKEIQFQYLFAYALVIDRGSTAFMWRGKQFSLGPRLETKTEVEGQIGRSPSWRGAKFGKWSIGPSDDASALVLIHHQSRNAVLVTWASNGYIHHRNASGAWKLIKQSGITPLKTSPPKIDNALGRTPSQNDLVSGEYVVGNWKIKVTADRLELDNTNGKGTLVIQLESDQVTHNSRVFAADGAMTFFPKDK